MNRLFVSQSDHGSTINFVNLLEIKYLFCKLTLNELSASRIQNKLTFFLLHEFTIHLRIYNLKAYVSRIYYKTIIFFANSLWIHYKSNIITIYFTMNYEFTICWRNYYEYTTCFMSILWIHLFYRELKRISLSITRIDYEFSIFLYIYYDINNYFANSLWNHEIHFLFHKFVMDSFFFRISYLFR